jgi:Calcineurin-like phosphoesterase
VPRGGGTIVAIEGVVTEIVQQPKGRVMSSSQENRPVRVRGLVVIAFGVSSLLPLACSSAPSENPGSSTEASVDTCPVSIKIPTEHEAVGQSIQISVTQSCSKSTSAMIAYIDSVDCASSKYPYPNAGCHTNNGAENFSSATWVKVTPGTHTLVVNDWNSHGVVGVSAPITFTYTPSVVDAGHDSGGGKDSGKNPENDPVLIAAGDIAYPNGAAASTGDLVRTLLGTNPGSIVITLGDNAYGQTGSDQGSAESFQDLYEPTWGSFIANTLPVPGNHDYGNWDLGMCEGCLDGGGRVMSGYYAYFSGHAITVGGNSPTTLHYGYDFTTKGGDKWRYISLNTGFCFYTPSNCAVGSSEYEWFAGELAGHAKKSKGGTYAGIIVGTHFNANTSQDCKGGNGQIDPLTELMYDSNVDLYLAGHVHNYERFCNLARTRGTTTQANCGTLDGPVCDAAGPMEINVGTGGAAAASNNDPWAASQARLVVPGVIKLTLHDSSWDFAFYNTSSKVLDSGSDIATH